MSKESVEKIYKLKGRDYRKPLIILLADIEQAEELGMNLDDLEPLRRLWPAQLTVIVPTTHKTPDFLHRGTHTLAVRVPDNDELRGLIRQVGPLVSTSANPQGQDPTRTVKQAKKYFGDKLDFYIDAGELKASPSTLARLEKGRLRILRQGAYVVPTDKLY